MKTGEATCRLEHAEEWAVDRVNPCPRCFSKEWAAGDIATATVELDGDQS